MFRLLHMIYANRVGHSDMDASKAVSQDSCGGEQSTPMATKRAKTKQASVKAQTGQLSIA